MGSEKHPGIELGAASWRGAEHGFVGDVLEAAAQLGRSEEAELWAQCAAGQVLTATWGRGPASGAPAAVLELALSPLPAARSHHPLLWPVPGTAGRFVICF